MSRRRPESYCTCVPTVLPPLPSIGPAAEQDGLGDHQADEVGSMRPVEDWASIGRMFGTARRGGNCSKGASNKALVPVQADMAFLAEQDHITGPDTRILDPS